MGQLHCKEDRLRNEIRMRIRDKRVESMKSIGSCLGALQEIGMGGESTWFLKNTEQITVPFKIAMAKEVRKVNVEFKTVAATMTLLQKDIGGNVITISICVVGKLVVECSEMRSCSALANRRVAEESLLIERSVE